MLIDARQGQRLITKQQLHQKSQVISACLWNFRTYPCTEDMVETHFRQFQLRVQAKGHQHCKGVALCSQKPLPSVAAI